MGERKGFKMKDFNEMEIYEDDTFEKEVSQENYDYFFNELKEIREKTTGCLLCWICPDEDDGHVEYKAFSTWTDMEIWKNQK